jgi:hypothetical protein
MDWNNASLVEAATAYHEQFGWNVIPTKRDKKPMVKWSPFQEHPIDPKRLAGWFASLQVCGLAVILGNVSGYLVCRDFDEVDSYEVWKANHSDLAGKLPTVKTHRGYHVYFRCPTIKTRDFGNGELRGGRSYMILPSSLHPEGTRYQWIIPVTPDKLITLDPVKAGFVPSTSVSAKKLSFSVSPLPLIRPKVPIPIANPRPTPCKKRLCPVTDETERQTRLKRQMLFSKQSGVSDRTVRTDIPYSTKRPDKPVRGTGARSVPIPPTAPQPNILCNRKSLSSGIRPPVPVRRKPNRTTIDLTPHHEAIEKAIQDTLPKKPGMRDKMIFEFARALKAVPELAELEAEAFLPWVKKWHRQALPVITTEAFEETWEDFCYGWYNVKYPKGILLKLAMEQAQANPEETISPDFPLKRGMVSLCRELQNIIMDEPFFLATTTLSDLFGINRMRAHRMLFNLEQEGWIQTITKGNAHLATRFRYTGPP